LERLKERDHLEDSSADGRIILKWILGKQCECVDLIHLTQDRLKWWDIANMVMNLRVP
jgi:hypothetical protein